MDLKQWVTQAFVKVMDPDREARVESLSRRMLHEIYTKKSKCDLKAAVEGLDFKLSDLELAKERVYRRVLTAYFKDKILTEKERTSANWVAEKLEIPKGKLREINTEFAKEYFAVALAKAMADGELDDYEEECLTQIAKLANCTLPAFARAFYRTEGERFLRGVFGAYVADDHLSKQEWQSLLKMAEKLGLSRSELLAAIQSQAQQFVEHVLADAKADGHISEREKETLDWLLNNLGLPSEHRRYVASEIARLQQVEQIEAGTLPTQPPPQGLEIRAGEIVHFHTAAMWRHCRLLKSGLRSDDHQGTLTLLDSRLIFSSPTKSQTVRYRRIVAHRGADDRIEIQVANKPTWEFYFPRPLPLAYAIFAAALRMANQTLVAKTGSAPSRHIPRDVRQRVWQRYGGRCAECRADNYLEFDHIIPVAKGGGNTDQNIQLLCRRCNLTKSDHI